MSETLEAAPVASPPVEPQLDELSISEAMVAGVLPSPQKYMNVWLFDIRITGTGRAYRKALDEHVWRDPGLYLNDRFLQRCNGLQVIWEHPNKATLNSEEFAKRTIGSVFIPYIKDGDVWAIVKIYDEDAAKQMSENELSTSPAVVLRETDSTRVEIGDGSALLIEGEPILLDHIAICGLGVWDTDGVPKGVRTDTQRTLGMADEDEKKKADAGEKLDALLTGLDSMSKRFDSFEKRMDAMEDCEKKRMDSEVKAKADADEDEKKKADAALKADADAKAKADADDEEEKKKCDADAAAKADADAKAKADADEEEKKKADATKADAQRHTMTDADIDARVLAALRERDRSDTIEERDAKVSAQSRADSIYSQLGMRGAPPAMVGETSSAYRVRLAKGVQKHSAAWKEVDLHVLQTQALGIAEHQIYADAATAARFPTDLPENTLIEVPIRDPMTNLLRFEFRGKHTYIHALKRPSSRVVKMRDGRGE